MKEKFEKFIPKEVLCNFFIVFFREKLSLFRNTNPLELELNLSGRERE